MIKLEAIFPILEKENIGKVIEEYPNNLRPEEFRLEEGKSGPKLKYPGDVSRIFSEKKSGFFLHSRNIDYMFMIDGQLPIKCFIDLNADRECAVEILVRMAPARPSFAFACQPAERNARNRVVHDLDVGRMDAWVGGDLEKYVPGLYWLTLLPSDLIAKHGIPIDALSQAAIEHRELEGGQHLFRFYERPEDWRTTGKIDELIAANEGFFNIEKARQALVGIKKFLPANEALRAWN